VGNQANHGCSQRGATLSLVYKAWTFDTGIKGNHRPRRALMDEFGNLFYPGRGGWSPPYYWERVIRLPTPIVFSDWWSGWWEQNWRLPDWSWLYMMEG
jgi:hypothetical protein